MSKPISNTSSPEQHGFFDNPKTIRWIRRALYTICALLLIADFVVHRHIYVYFERLPAFYPLYGFVSCVGLVLIAQILRSAVKRDENYYGEAEHSPADEIEKSPKEAE